MSETVKLLLAIIAAYCVWVCGWAIWLGRGVAGDKRPKIAVFWISLPALIAVVWFLTRLGNAIFAMDR